MANHSMSHDIEALCEGIGWYSSVERITSGARAVVRLRVKRVNVVADYDTNSIYTDVECELLEVLKGDLKVGQILTVREHGGQVGDLIHRTGPGPELRQGTEWFLAVSYYEPRGWWTPHAMRQGGFQIFGEDTVRDFGGFHFMVPPPASVMAR